MNTPSLYRTLTWISIVSLILTAGFSGSVSAQSGPTSPGSSAGPSKLPTDKSVVPDRINPDANSPMVSVMPTHGVGISAAASITAQPDSKGTDFWLTFPGNHVGGVALTLFITGDVDTTGTVSIPGLAFSAPFAVTAGTVTSVGLPETAELDSISDIVQNLGIHVTTQSEVAVYGLNRKAYTTDAYLGLPTDILGLEYIVLAWKNTLMAGDALGSQFAMVATQDATAVTIVPSVTTGGRAAGVPYVVSLNQGQAYQLRNGDADADLSGTIITSDKPIAVFGGHRCANIPNANTLACDHVVEELPPTSTWGKSFVTVPLATRLNGDTFRFLASTDGTTVSVNGAAVATLNRGQLHEQNIAGPATITADKPILVAQYSNGSTWDNVTSDPFMMLIPPYVQFLGGYTVTTPASGFVTNYINVVAPTAAVGAITVDGSPIPAGSFTAIGSSGFSGAQVSVALGSHTLAGPLPFGAFMYGFDSYDSYGYPGGLSLAPIAVVAHLTLAPKTATNPTGTQHCVTATVTDQSLAPVVGVRVDFVVTGVNPNAGFDNTDQAGQAHFCYVGANAGADTITASSGTLVDTATKTWTSGTTQLLGWAFLDANLDGFRQDSEQPGVAGLVITLSQGGSTVATTKTVGSDGYYLFSDLLGGNYCATLGGYGPKYVPTSPTQVCFTIGTTVAARAKPFSPSAPAKNTGGINGTLTLRTPDAMADVPLVIGGGWAQFNFGGTGSFNPEGAFTFSAPSPTTVKVTDAFCRGDQFRVYDNAVAIGDTTSVPVVQCGSSDTEDPDVAFADPSYSWGAFVVGAGAHAITLQAIASPFVGGGAYLRADAAQVAVPTKVVNFGLRLSKATIGDFVWFDMNGNGTQDPGEPGIPGVTVALWSSVGGAPGAIVGAAVTGPDGKYSFATTAGDYFVQVTDAAHMLAGLVLTTGPQSKPNPFGPVTVHDGDAYADADFGYAFPCAPGRGVIAGRVWHDANGNGAAEPTEAGIPGIQVAAEPLSYLAIRAAATNPLGIYMICVPAGTYLVAPLNPPAGMTPEQQHRLPVIVQPGAWLTDINFGYR